MNPQHTSAAGPKRSRTAAPPPDRRQAWNKVVADLFPPARPPVPPPISLIVSADPEATAKWRACLPDTLAVLIEPDPLEAGVRMEWPAPTFPPVGLVVVDPVHQSPVFVIRLLRKARAYRVPTVVNLAGASLGLMRAAAMCGAAGLLGEVDAAEEARRGAVAAVWAGNTYWSRDVHTRLCDGSLMPPRIYPAEAAVLNLLFENPTYTRAEMAAELGIGVAAARRRLATLREKFQVNTRADILAAADRVGWPGHWFEFC